MRRGILPVIALAAVPFTVTAWAAPEKSIQTAQQVVAPPQEKPKPDLVITAFNLMSWGPCAPGQTVFTFNVTVKNQGLGSWSGAEPAVVVKDIHDGVGDAWGTGVGIDPPLKPGEVRRLQVPITYYSANPSHMGKACPHPFQAVVNSNHVVQESNFNNNAGPGPAVWHGFKVIMVCPDACTKK
ncbi:MAG TPA: CARDB domain-containing protein [Thermoanaerobaculaceae bacterium]|nr:CARDB domain-containing protein [Thermoanaerobaculaceae bacterium]